MTLPKETNKAQITDRKEMETYKQSKNANCNSNNLKCEGEK